MPIKENDLVRTLVEKGRWPAGQIGPVVDVCGGGRGITIEVWNEDRYPVDVVTYDVDEVEVVDDGIMPATN